MCKTIQHIFVFKCHLAHYCSKPLNNSVRFDIAIAGVRRVWIYIHITIGLPECPLSCPHIFPSILHSEILRQ